MSNQLVPQDERLWAVIAQLSPYVSTFVGPLVVLLVFGSRGFPKYHATQALMLQVALWIAGIAISVISAGTCGLGAILYLALLPFALAPAFGAWKAWNGEWWGFPMVSGFGK